MSRRTLGFVLLLSLGVNLGLLAAVGLQLWSDRRAPSVEEVVEEPAALETGALLDEERFRVETAPVRRRAAALADELGLEGERRDRFVAVQRRFLEGTWIERRRVLGLQLRLRRELGAPRPDQRTVDELIDQLAAARRELDRGLARTVFETRELLEPEEERLYLRFLDELRPGPGGGRRPFGQHLPRGHDGERHERGERFRPGSPP